MAWRLGTAWASGLLALVLAAPAVVEAQFQYTTNNGAITITGYTGSGGAVTIPSATNGLPVTSIGDSAFYGCSVTAVSIPSSVTNIGDHAFYDCFELTNVYFEGNAPGFGAGVFAADWL